MKQDNPRKILIVDDEADIGLMVSSFVRTKGFEPIVVQAFATAKKQLDGHQYDYAFVDVNLPDGSGLDLVPVIHDENADCTIVVMSAHEDLDPTKSDETLVSRFLHKPFTKGQVLQVLEDYKEED